MLGPLAENGGCTPTHRPLNGSPAIDKGKSFGVASDQRGAPRPFDFASTTDAAGGDGSDIGAFELGSPLLNIQRTPTKNVIVTWPLYYGDFTLESAPALPASNNWSTVSNATIVGNQFNVTNSAVDGNKLYRLKGF
ncbi:MAG: hypothetical protein HY298_06990 [Verrucomicrobia bacterium]|nr:hypothetical protein [Verrucomicrobiota bacterium]